eukprot:c28949_g1_i1 orf=744-914(+)
MRKGLLLYRRKRGIFGGSLMAHGWLATHVKHLDNYGLRKVGGSGILDLVMSRQKGK